jgi:hypothetical protein
MQVTIAAQACLLLLAREHNFYPKLQTILVYPSAFRDPRPWTGPDGVVRPESPVHLGEAWYRGPVIIAWDEALAAGRREIVGRNVVFHEFAHELDGEDLEMDGAPALRDAAEYQQWDEVITAELRQLRQSLRHGEATLLDPYGATNRKEFFAVATECFFEQPAELRQEHPRLYETLQLYYRQDPAARGGPK